jgi:hypothetical protein
LQLLFSQPQYPSGQKRPKSPTGYESGDFCHQPRGVNLFYPQSSPHDAGQSHETRRDGIPPSSKSELKRPSGRFARKIVKYFTN